MRAARTALFAAVCTALGATGHAHMSGTDVPVWGLLGAFAVTGALAWPAAARRRGPAGITAALLTVQTLLHLVFSTTAPAPSAGSGHGMEGMEGMEGAAGMHSLHSLHGMHEAAGTAGHPRDGLGALGALDGLVGDGGFGMLLAHLLAGLLCAAWLAWGEATVFRLAGVLGAAALLAARPLARAVALVRTRPAPVPGRPAPRPSYARPRRLRGAVHAHALVRRGPPRRRDIRATAPGRPTRACV
ncbi:hypothetical protein AB0B01_29585 [Streptomyces sp. NPDC044571]|uniref:hypothetical protein n=1 Tax=Streptomyces sp. NPDC044571 TaxID=3155371 RepID=UPI003401AE8E